MLYSCYYTVIRKEKFFSHLKILCTVEPFREPSSTNVIGNGFDEPLIKKIIGSILEALNPHQIRIADTYSI